MDERPDRTCKPDRAPAEPAPERTSEPGPRRPSPKDEREARLAEALRANLRRRKAQQRGRSNPGAPSSDED
jgi:hypothetical protein